MAEASRLRLRPILMSSIAFMGVLPLITATGAAAAMRSAIGVAVFSSMIGVTAFGLFLSVLYGLLRRVSGNRPPQKHDASEPVSGRDSIGQAA